MPRNIDELRKQYNSSQTQSGGMGRPGGGPGGGRNNPGRQQGKPKDARKTIARLFTYLHGQRVRLVFVLLCMLFTTLTSLVGGYLTAPIIDRLTLAVKPDAVINMTKVEIAADGFIRSVLSAVFGGAEATAFQYIIAAVTILGVVYVIGIATAYIQAKLMMHITQNFLTDIRNDLFTKLQRLPVRYFDSKPVGEIMSRFTNDIDNLDSMVSNSLTSIISGTVTLIGTFIFMITTSWILTLVTVVFIPVFMFGGLLLAKRSRKYYSSQQAALGAINGYMEETVTGQKVIKVFNHEDECEEEFGLLNDDMRDKQFKAQFWGGIMGPVMGNMSQISYAVTVGVGGILMLAGYLTPGGLSIFARYARQFAMPINQLSQQMATVFSALAGAERVFEVMDTDPEKPDVPDAKTMDGMQGYVVLENVTFGYVPGKTVLKNISLYAKPGQKIAFVGSTGAGKTTVTNLISRFYDVEEGTITIDGVDIRDIKRDELRSHIAMVLQDTHLFTGTVMENIRYGRLDATDEEVIAAAKTASAHSFIMRLSDGYNTMLEGDGANLSQGQRQLLNIARAAVSKAPILILDEATSSVDTRTERHIEHGMDRLMKNRTTF
ncbi:MAG: ABC transporter ATP-binding protein, partial [Clostridia bacterium]|nr:ABC transporter ATP-binding protein [Clostridia bacterium]